MSRDPAQRLADMLRCCRKIMRYTNGTTLKSLLENEMAYDAVHSNLVILTEAARNLPDSAKASFPNVPWREIIAMRTLLVHEYFRLNEYVLWPTVTEDFPALADQIEEFLHVPRLV